MCNCWCHAPSWEFGHDMGCLHCRRVGYELMFEYRTQDHRCDASCNDPNSEENRLLRQIFEGGR